MHLKHLALAAALVAAPALADQHGDPLDAYEQALVAKWVDPSRHAYNVTFSVEKVTDGEVVDVINIVSVKDVDYLRMLPLAEAAAIIQARWARGQFRLLVAPEVDLEAFRATVVDGP